jgi:hypothetical protein
MVKKNKNQKIKKTDDESELSDSKIVDIEYIDSLDDFDIEVPIIILNYFNECYTE